jgi:hypothetical protein
MESAQVTTIKPRCIIPPSRQGPQKLGFTVRVRVRGSGLLLGFRIRVQSFTFRVILSGFRVQDLGFRV